MHLAILAAPARPRVRPARLRVESLEGRDVPATITVDTNLDVVNPTDGKTSLREAIAQSADGDTIVFKSTLAGKTVKLSDELVIDHSLNIDGVTATGLLALAKPTISAGKSSRIFEIKDSAAVVRIDDLILSDGLAASTAPNPAQGGAIYSAAGTLTITNVMFAGNSARGGDGLPTQDGGDALGGAVYNARGNLTIQKSTFTGNVVQAGNGGDLGGKGGFAAGGAVYNTGGQITLDQNTFSLNFAFGGVGGQLKVGAVQATNAAVVIAPQANGSVGATGTQGGDVLVEQAINISVAGGDGGGAAGGAVYNRGGAITATKNTFSGNMAWGGLGGLLKIDKLVAANLAGVDATQLNIAIASVGVTQGGSVTVRQSIDVAIGNGSNGGVGTGGALANVGGALTSSGNTYSKNTARGGMGGQVVVGGVEVGNQAVVDAAQTNINVGGGDVSQGGPVTVTQSVVFNLAVAGARGGDGLGGGIYNTAAGSTDNLSKYQSNKVQGGRGGIVYLQGGDFGNAAYVNGSQVNVNLGGRVVQQGGNVTVLQTTAVTLAAPSGGNGLGGGFYNTGAGFKQTVATYTGNKAAGGKGGWLLFPPAAPPDEGDGVNTVTDTVAAPPPPLTGIRGSAGVGQGGSLYDTSAV